jgi:hypothetical protein
MFFVCRLLPLSTLVSFSNSARNNFTTTACHAINMLQDYPVGLGTYQITPEQVPFAISSVVRLGYYSIDEGEPTMRKFFKTERPLKACENYFLCTFGMTVCTYVSVRLHLVQKSIQILYF